jgi:NADH-quinone oxidoreductase subunit L
MLELIWLVPTLPLVGVVVLVVAGRRLGEPAAGWLATTMVGGSFLAAVLVFVGLLGEPAEERHFVQTLFEWIHVGGLEVDAAFLVDPLSMTMVLFITGVSALIHLYAIGYMHGDAGFSRFFTYLNLFVFSMLLLVLGDNLVLTFLGWEGVGACSYLLISFWFTSEANASAGKKAFVTNRVGDVGFMLAMFLTFATLGTLEYLPVLDAAEGLSEVTATAIAGLLFVGAIGKSAQLPLYVWLPDAMAGPTPVSALIHAATMVTSGVYLLVRMNPILAGSADWLPMTVAVVGAATALFAATVAIAQNDIKKVLAYSTVSQLGYMFLAVGSGAYVAAIFHMVTHAFFKALLFLGAGSVIHGMHEEQDMRRMGGLAKFMPITTATFLVGWLAIAGIPPFAGFWSKDEILLSAWEFNTVLWAVGLLVALLTAFYMSRQVFLVFFGTPRWAGAGAGGDHQVAEDTATATSGGEAAALAEPAHADAGGHDDHALEPHESPWLMTVPLVVLAGLAAVAGGLNLPFDGLHFLLEWLEPVVHEHELEVHVGGGLQLTLAVVAAATAVIGILAAAAVYLRRRVRPVEPAILERAWGVDAAMAAFFDGPGRKAADGMAWFDRTVVDGAVNGAGAGARALGARLRPLQTGFVRSYALGMAAGAVGLLAWFLVRAGL